MNTNKIAKLCYWICIANVVVGAAIAFTLIWVTQDNQFLWKSLLSVGVVFFASGVTLTVCKAIDNRTDATKKSEDRHDAA